MSSPPDWAVSVGSYHYWRAVGVGGSYPFGSPNRNKTEPSQQDEVKPLLPMLQEAAASDNLKTYLKRLDERLNSFTAVQEQVPEQVMKIEIGNTYSLRPHSRMLANPHLFTLFVRPSRPEVLFKITVLLHETFKNREQKYETNLSEILLPIYARDTFTVKAFLQLKDGYKWQGEDGKELADQNLEIHWLLSFEKSAAAEPRKIKLVQSNSHRGIPV